LDLQVVLPCFYIFNLYTKHTNKNLLSQTYFTKINISNKGDNNKDDNNYIDDNNLVVDDEPHIYQHTVMVLGYNNNKHMS